MLEKLQKIAITLKPWRQGFLLLATLALGFGVYVLVVSSSQEDDLGLIPALILFTWATMAHSFTSLFVHIPAQLHIGMKFIDRVKLRFSRALYYGFVVLFACATAFLLLTSWQLFSAWRMMY